VTAVSVADVLSAEGEVESADASVWPAPSETEVVCESTGSTGAVSAVVGTDDAEIESVSAGAVSVVLLSVIAGVDEASVIGVELAMDVVESVVVDTFGAVLSVNETGSTSPLSALLTPDWLSKAKNSSSVTHACPTQSMSVCTDLAKTLSKMPVVA
jgi:hypothetical protein